MGSIDAGKTAKSSETAGNPHTGELARTVQMQLRVMLKITLHDSAGELRFRLEGRLSGAWVGELRQCWLTAQSTVHSRKTTLDLAEVDYVDGDGQSLLAEMFRHGVTLRAVTPLIRELVQEIERTVRCDTVEGAPAHSTNALDSTHAAAPHRRAL
jgi:ABC-type transporter Mla MlaB component